MSVSSHYVIVLAAGDSSVSDLCRQPMRALTSVESARLVEMVKGPEFLDEPLKVLLRCFRRGLAAEYAEGVASGKYKSEAERGVPYDNVSGAPEPCKHQYVGKIYGAACPTCAAETVRR